MKDALIQNFAAEVATALEQLRQSQGMSRSELARRIDRSPSYVTRALSGSHNNTVETVEALGSAMGATISINFHSLNAGRLVPSTNMEEGSWQQRKTERPRRKPKQPRKQRTKATTS